MRIKVSGGRIIDPANNIDKKTNLYIDNGKIIAIQNKLADFTADKTIEAKNSIICPGLVDLSVQIRDPGQQHTASIKTETVAAVHGGITSICCPPDTNPVIDNPSVVEHIHQHAKTSRCARVFPLGAMTRNLEGDALAEMWTLMQAGCIGISNAQSPVNNTEVLRRAFEYAATFDITVHIYCEDSYLHNNGVAHEGAVSVRLGLPAIPETAETVAVSRALLLIEQCGARVHFCRLSCARSIELIADAKQQGLPVTADVSIANLHLTETDLANFYSNCHLRPPLRSQRDKSALISGIANGTIDAICSNHQPLDIDDKSAPFSQTVPGASLIETLLPLTLHLVENNNLDLNRAIDALTRYPANIAGVTAGTLTPGAPADVCIFNPEEHWTLEPARLASAGKNTPFAGWELTGKVTHTLVNGKIVYKK